MSDSDPWVKNERRENQEKKNECPALHNNMHKTIYTRSTVQKSKEV